MPAHIRLDTDDARRFLGALLIALASFGIIQGSDLYQLSELRGRILDPDHAAIAGARITAVRNGRADVSTTSNSDGEFSISLEPGEYILKISADGFAEVGQTIRSKPTTFEPLEIVLPLSGYTATVTVTDMAGYEGLAIRSATKTLTSLRDVPQSI
ncbi:MAG TPA: carboxypeptidase-like regulatory domain-containing protein, partial [Pyrinomonadaceae bacterium]|nr:carboxypeptidase-like regulatory domain-containing protein [Pyrinomonadaceae bacterium]